MAKPITNITIVGGGTSGWITASYLIHRYKKRREVVGEDLKITVIESPDTAILGVGEATVPTLKATLQIAGISEAEFFARTDATFKLGILFKDWNRAADGSPIRFVHPFTGGLTCDGMNPGYSFKRYGITGRMNVTDQDFVRTIGHARDAIEANRGPRALNGPEFGGGLQYAYHIDAGKLADFLAEVAKARGVAHIRDRVDKVNLDERGFVASLSLRERGDWPVELIVDCTGFRGLIINEALGEPFESYSDYLLNDRAIPIQIPHETPDRIESVTTSTALDAGWSWNIPLQNRIGTGYVYSSAFKSDDEAKKEFIEFLGPRAEGADPRVIKMRVGHTRRSWVKNCVAIGLSSGFIEPLESTAIMSVELQARWLLAYMPSTDFEEPMTKQFNWLTEQLYAEVRDFLSMHFTQTNREDTPYWRAMRHEAKKSDSFAEHLQLWKTALPSPADPRRKQVFNNWSVACILMGKDFYKDAQLGVTEVVPSLTWQKYCDEIWQRKRVTLGRIAIHKRLVDHMVKSAIAGKSNIEPAATIEPKVQMGGLTVEPQPVMAQTD